MSSLNHYAMLGIEKDLDQERLNTICRRRAGLVRIFEHVSTQPRTVCILAGIAEGNIHLPLARCHRKHVPRPPHYSSIYLSTAMANSLLVRHIQDHSEPNTTEQHHWGYPSRVLPCTSGAGTCAYLDAVYWMHDTSMLYTFILWGVLLGILVVWVTIRGWRMGGPEQRMNTLFDRCCNWLGDARRRWLLPDTPGRWLFGRVSRLQVVILAVMLGYLLIFS